MLLGRDTCIFMRNFNLENLRWSICREWGMVFKEVGDIGEEEDKGIN